MQALSSVIQDLVDITIGPQTQQTDVNVGDQTTTVGDQTTDVSVGDQTTTVDAGSDIDIGETTATVGDTTQTIGDTEITGGDQTFEVGEGAIQNTIGDLLAEGAVTAEGGAGGTATAEGGAGGAATIGDISTGGTVAMLLAVLPRLKQAQPRVAQVGLEALQPSQKARSAMLLTPAG